MRQRGRKGVQSLAVAGAAGTVEVMRRPDPPLDLTPEESDVWSAVVGAMPANWFGPATWPLLAQYCRHTVTARRVAQLIDAALARPEIDVRELRDLTGMQTKETASLKAMASAMRISQQASYSDRGAAGEKARVSLVRPWE